MSKQKPQASGRAAQQLGADTMRAVTAVGAIVGLLLVMVALIIAATEGTFAKAYWAPLWLLCLGFLAIIFFVFFNFEWLAKVVTGRAALSGVLVAVMCAGAVALWVCGNLLFNSPGRFNFKFWDKKAHRTKLFWSGDYTKTQLFSLSKKTHRQLDELENKLKITVIYRASPQEGPELDALLERYREYSDKVELEFLMPGEEGYELKRKKLAQTLKKDSADELAPRSVSLVYGKDRFKYLTWSDFWDVRFDPRRGMGLRGMQQRVFKGEEALTSAIYEMLDPEKTKVYFVVDHGERSPDDERTGRGLSKAAALLKRSNIEWETLDLRTREEIPKDASVVVVCGPKRAITASEITVLRKFLDDRKGRLLICLDEARREVALGLDPLLAHLGIEAGRDLVVEPDTDFVWGNYPEMTIGKKLGMEPRALLEKLDESNIRPTFRLARSLRPLERYRGKFSAHDLCSGSADSYGETDLATYINSRQTKFDKDVDTKGPVIYAMAAWEGPTPRPFGRMEKTLGRVVVVGDSDWCSDMLLYRIADNRTFFMASINWLAGKEKRIEIEPKLADNDTYHMGAGHVKMSKYVLWSLFVVLILASGLVIWVRRR